MEVASSRLPFCKAFSASYSARIWRGYSKESDSFDLAINGQCLRGSCDRATNCGASDILDDVWRGPRALGKVGSTARATH